MAEPSLKKNFSLSLAYQILTLITPFITTPYISRVLEPDGIGITSYTSSIMSMFVLFASLGTMSYGTVEIAKVREDVEKRSQLFWEIELLSVISTSLVMIAWGFFIWMSNQYQLIYLILTLNLITVMLDVSWFFAGLEEFKYIVYRNFAIKIIGVILMFVFIREKNDLELNIFLMAFISMLGIASMWFYLKGRVKRPKIEVRNIARHLHETMIYFVPTIASSIYSVLDKTLIGAITDDAHENGYYEQATKVAFMAKAVTFGALNSVMMSRQSYLFSSGRFSEMKERIDRSIDTIMFIGLGICMGVIGVANTFVPLFFGPGYEPVVFLMQLLIPVILFSGVGDCLGSHYYNPSGLRAKSARYIVAGAILNLLCNLLLIPRLGSVGAVIGTLAAEFFIACLYVYNCNGFLRLRQILEKVWKRIIAGTLMVLVMVFVYNIGLDYIYTILLQCIAGASVYLLLLWIMKDTFLTYLIKDVVYAKIKKR